MDRMRPRRQELFCLDDQSATYYGYRNGSPATCGNKDGDKETHYVSAYTPVEFLVDYLGDMAGKPTSRPSLVGHLRVAATDLGTDLRSGRTAMHCGHSTTDRTRLSFLPLLRVLSFLLAERTARSVLRVLLSGVSLEHTISNMYSDHRKETQFISVLLTLLSVLCGILQVRKA